MNVGLRPTTRPLRTPARGRRDVDRALLVGTRRVAVMIFEDNMVGR